MSPLPTRPNLPAQVVAERFQLHLPSLPHWIEAGAEFLRQKAVLCGACGESRSGKLLVAMHEALANAVIHGNLEISSQLKEEGDDAFARALAQRSADAGFNERMVEIDVDYDGQRCQWTITDEGKGFDVEKVLARCLSDDPEVLLASGRGILMMRSFLDEVRFEKEGRRLVMTMTRESGQERRRKPRLHRKESLRIVPMRADGSADWEASYAAVARNFSAEGVGVFQEKLIHTDRILIGLDVGGSLVYIPAQVRHCKSVGGDIFELGCSFVADPTATDPNEEADSQELPRVHEAVEAILRANPEVPPDDRRAEPRVVYNERVEIAPISGGPAVVGFGRDLSKGGMALVTSAALPLERAIVALRQNEGPPLRIHSRIVRCDKIQNNFYDVGIRFRTLADQRN